MFETFAANHFPQPPPSSLDPLTIGLSSSCSTETNPAKQWASSSAKACTDKSKTNISWYVAKEVPEEGPKFNSLPLRLRLPPPLPTSLPSFYVDHKQVPPAKAKHLSPKAQRLLGYGISPPFCGFVNYKDPMSLFFGVNDAETVVL